MVSIQESLRIAVWHNLPSGGGKRALYDHVRGLLERGHHIEVWRPSSADQQFLPLSELCPEHVLPLNPPSAAPGRGPGRLFQRYRYTRRLLGEMDRHAQACARQINEARFDVVFANSCRYFRTSPLARYLRGPSALYLGEPYRLIQEALPNPPWAAPPAASHWPTSWRGLKWRLNDWSRIFSMRVQLREEHAWAKAFRLILVNSLFSRESVLRAYGLESKVCRLGIDTDQFHPLEGPPEGYVAGVGTVEYIKGIDRAIEALATIDKRRRPALRWIGNDSDAAYKRQMSELAHVRGVTVEFHVGLAGAELVSLLSRAKAMIYCSRLEPFGLAPLEANACGVPVVAIAEGGLRETIVDGINGLLVEDADPESVGQAILRLTCDDEYNSMMRHRARRHVVSNWGLAPAILRLETHLAKLTGGTETTRRSTHNYGKIGPRHASDPVH